MVSYNVYAKRREKTVKIDMTHRARMLQCLVDAGIGDIKSGKGFDIKIIYSLCENNNLNTKSAPLTALYERLRYNVRTEFLNVRKPLGNRKKFYLGIAGKKYLDEHKRFDNPNAPLMRKWSSKQEI